MATKTIVAAANRTEASPGQCSFVPLLVTIGKPHTLLVLYGLGKRSPMRFTELEKELGIQPKTLAARLNELVEIGLVERKSFNEIPPRVEYSLTKSGKDLGIIFSAMNEWAKKHTLHMGA